MKRMHTPHIELLKTCNRLQGILLYLLNLCEPKSYPERNRCFMLFFQKHIFRHTEQLLARMASFAACECGAEQTSTMSPSPVQCIDPPTDYMARRFWKMRQPNGCSTPSPISRRDSSGKKKNSLKRKKKKSCQLECTKRWIALVARTYHS